MSSAAKLRRFGKGTAAVAVAATVMTAFGPAAFADWNIPNSVQAGGNVTDAVGGSIGIVDTDKGVVADDTDAAFDATPAGTPTETSDENQGATLVMAGKTDQTIADIRFTLPNRFASGDLVELHLFDRSAKENSDGDSNIDADHLVGFSGTPKITVSDPQARTAVVANDTDAIAAGSSPGSTANTETTPDDPWVAENTPAVAGDVNDVKPSAAPAMSATLVKDWHQQGSNIIRMQVSNSSAGDPSGKWVVTVSGLKVNLGSKVTPGDLRVVPFARSAVGGTLQNSQWFTAPPAFTPTVVPNPTPATGNAYTEGNLAARQIAVYTVPAMVSPITIGDKLTGIISDGTAQSAGQLGMTETQPYSLGNGDYRLVVDGASIRNADVTSLKLTTTGGPATETVTLTAAAPYVGANGTSYADLAALTAAGTTWVGINFSVAGADATKVSTITVDGLNLSSATPGSIRYRVSGGTISDIDPEAAPVATAVWLASPAGTGTLPAGAPALVGPAADFDGATGAVNQGDIMAPIDELYAYSTASAGTSAIGGNNRYETARKIAKEWSPLGDEAIIASGENYPDALSSGFLAQRLGAPVILSMQGSVPADTMESLRERGVRKVYLIGGEAALSKGVSDKLLATPSYMWSDSAKNLVPRGGNLEVVRLGGTSRYSTNALVNMYAAAQNTGVAVVGKTTPSYPSAQKTTAMLARGDNFADALTANVLTSGRNTGLFTTVGGGVGTTYALASAPVGLTADQTSLGRLGAGQFYVRDNGGTLQIATLPVGGSVIAAATAAGGSASTYTAPGGLVTFNIPLTAGQNFQVTSTSGTGQSVPQLENLNALPVLLTPKGELGAQAKQQLLDLHIEHVLVVGGADVVPDAVVKSVDGMSITTRRLAGKDRYETAAAVNLYAWTASTASATNTTPGLGFDGGVNPAAPAAARGQGEAFLANGTRFPDALVAGPWVSRRHDAMVLVLQSSIPDPTKKFLNDAASLLDRAIGLGLGSAVSSTVIMEANKIVASK